MVEPIMDAMADEIEIAIPLVLVLGVLTLARGSSEASSGGSAVMPRTL